MKRPLSIACLAAALTVAGSARTARAESPSTATSTTTSAETKPAEVKPAEKPAETKPAEKPAEAKPADQAKTAPKPFANGYTITSGDDKFSLRLRGILQVDGRFFLGDDTRRFTDTFLLRTARPYLEGKAFGFATFRFAPDFGNGTATILDAYLDLEVSPALHFRLGKDTVSFGLERLQSQAVLLFPERSQVSGLTPNRDIGGLVWGSVLNGALAYSAGIWNGIPDAGNGDADSEDRKDYSGRIFVKPFKLVSGMESLGEIGFGFGAMHGIRRGSATAAGLPTYRTPAQQVLAVYDTSATTPANVAYANGPIDRWSPQGQIYYGPFGLQAEYVHVTQEVRQGNVGGSLTHDAWQVTANVFLTGEKARYAGPDVLSPASLEPFSPGAIELVLRYDSSRYSKYGFGKFIDGTRSYTGADSIWGAVNWYLNNVLRVNLTFVHSDLKDPPGKLPSSENAIIGRTQLWF